MQQAALCTCRSLQGGSVCSKIMRSKQGASCKSTSTQGASKLQQNFVQHTAARAQQTWQVAACNVCNLHAAGQSFTARANASLWHTQLPSIGLRLECCLGLQVDLQAAQLGVIGEPAEHAGGFEQVALLLLEVLLQGKQRSWQRETNITGSSASGCPHSRFPQLVERPPFA